MALFDSMQMHQYALRYAEIYAASNALELQNALDTAGATITELSWDGALNRAEERIAELERSLAEWQAMTASLVQIVQKVFPSGHDMEDINRITLGMLEIGVAFAGKSGNEELNALLAQARVMPATPTEETLQAIRDAIAYAKRISADEAGLVYEAIIAMASKGGE